MSEYRIKSYGIEDGRLIPIGESIAQEGKLEEQLDFIEGLDDVVAIHSAGTRHSRFLHCISRREAVHGKEVDQIL